MPRPPKFPEIAELVKVLQQNPFGALVLVLILGMALVAWIAR